MQYTEYGSTGKMVSALGYGGMRFDTEKCSLEENAELVRYASSQGINYFDTAPGYCHDLSEDIFGLAFRNMPKPFYVSTKGNPHQFDTAEKAYEAVCRSRERLGVEKIHFYHIWCLRQMADYELAMRPGGQYEGLLRAREEGLIEHIVCSSHQPGHEIRTVLSEGKVEGCLMGISIINFPYRWSGVEAARELKLGVVAMNPLAGGTIPQYPEAFAFLGGEHETPTQAALRFAIANPGITVALVGFTTREHIDEAVRIANEAIPMTDAEVAEVAKHVGQHMNTFCTGCGYCDSCPQGIPIPGYLQFYNRKLLYNSDDAEMTTQVGNEKAWGMLVADKPSASACIQCGLCEQACTQHLSIMERLGEIAAWEEAAQTLKE